MSSTFRRRASSFISVEPSSSRTEDDVSPPRTSVASSSKNGPAASSKLTSSSAHVTPDIALLSVVQRRGTKAWAGGTTLTSTGLYDFDSILGGGQPLGSAILIEEDRWVQDGAMSLMRYWSVEALSQGHFLILAATKSNPSQENLDELSSSHLHGGFTPSDCLAFLQTSLPRNLTWDKHLSTLETSHRDHKSSLQEDSACTAIPEEDEQQDIDDYDESTITQHDMSMAHTNHLQDDTSSDHLLSNAWQYKVSVQQERSGQAQHLHNHRPFKTQPSTPGLVSHDIESPNDQSGVTWSVPITDMYCHSYDLSGNCMDQMPPKVMDKYLTQDMLVLECFKQYTTMTPCLSLFQKWIHTILHVLQQHPSTVVRFLLPNIPCVSPTASALSLTLSYIRTHSLPVVLFVTVRPWLDRELLSSLYALRRVCDAVFSCQGFASLVAKPPSEFHDLQGILYMHKLSSLFPCTTQFNSSASSSSHSRRPLTHRYGIKRDRRRLTLQMLHLPPEHFSSGGSSVGSSSVRTGGGKPDKVSSTTRGSSSIQHGEETRYASISTSRMGCASSLGKPSSTSMEF